ncbi:rhodanese-like domain-containing protein [Rhodococcus aerolatus]
MTNPAGNAVPTTTVAELPDPLPADATLLDVREDGEWAAGHAPGALHVPLGDLPARVGEIPQDGPLYVVCHSGGRSARATAWLTQHGVEATNVDGGMSAWAAQGRPLEADGGATPSVG